VGDLGNVEVTNGVVETTITDHMVTLYGSLTVIDRSIVVRINTWSRGTVHGRQYSLSASLIRSIIPEG